MKTVYGPVSSWRLGKSLGVDLICSKDKICSFDCVYCQLGKTSIKTIERKKFISIDKMRKDIVESLETTDPDVITLSGTGEPTLAKNIDLAIETIREITDIPVAILTNSTLLGDKDVQKALFEIDRVVAKLDASNEKLFQDINKPVEGINLNDTIAGIKDFKEKFSGRLDIQTMFIKNNMDFAEDIADIVSDIEPDEIQINTPLRPCEVEPLTEEQLDLIERKFRDKDLKTETVYKSEKPKTSPMDKMEIFKRRRSYK
jgi:wyosine [tRNA(Phe)-imidazoG37] synthetase (radical SAM superfamily)